MRTHLPLLAALSLVPWLLACAGLTSTVDPQPHLQAICDAAGPVMLPTDLDLPSVDDPAVDLEPGVLLVVTADRLELDLAEVPLEELRDRVVRKRRDAAMTGDELVLYLAVAPDVPASRVARVLGLVYDAEVSTPRALGWSAEPWDVPPAPDPELAAQLRAEAATQDPAERQMRAAQQIMAEVRLCPGANEVFRAVASVSPEMKCTLVAHGLGEALPMCPLTDADRLVTMVQVLTEPVHPERPAAVALVLDPDANPTVVAPDLPWAELLPMLVAPGWVAIR